MTADNARFASVGGDRAVFLWDVEQGVTVRRWSGHTARIEAVQFAGEGDSVVVSGMTYIYTWGLIGLDQTKLRRRQAVQTLQ